MSLIFVFLGIVASMIIAAKLAKHFNLKKDHENEWIAGVCAGISKRVDLEPIVIRVAFILSVVMFGFGILPYIILWIVMDEEK